MPIGWRIKTTTTKDRIHFDLQNQRFIGWKRVASLSSFIDDEKRQAHCIATLTKLAEDFAND